MTPRGGKPRCTLAFFGIDRRLDLTGTAIHDLIYALATKYFDVKSVGFLWAPTQINNPRSGEHVDLPPPRFECLPDGRYDSAPPMDLTQESDFQTLKGFGDFWRDDFYSLGNLYSQLTSLARATDMALETQPDVVIFLRPDLLYQNSFVKVLERAAKHIDTAGTGRVFLPHWQPHGGLNDRFALCCGPDAIHAYGHRVQTAAEFCRAADQPLHSERLVRHALAHTPVTRIGLRAARMRSNGIPMAEDYSWHGWKPALRVMAGALRRQVWPKKRSPK